MDLDERNRNIFVQMSVCNMQREFYEDPVKENGYS